MTTPAVTSKNLPKPPIPEPTVPVHIPDTEMDATIVAKPLNAPDFETVKSANPLLAFRWVNFKVGEGESSLRFDEMQASGFVPATTNDVLNLRQYLRDGKFIKGDTILMKMDKKKYLGALKYNKEQAEMLATRATAAGRVSDVKTSLAGTNAPPELRNKVQPFVPTPQETAALVGEPDEE